MTAFTLAIAAALLPAPPPGETIGEAPGPPGPPTGEPGNLVWGGPPTPPPPIGGIPGGGPPIPGIIGGISFQ
jgi:hypothetical protein